MHFVSYPGREKRKPNTVSEKRGLPDLVHGGDQPDETGSQLYCATFIEAL